MRLVWIFLIVYIALFFIGFFGYKIMGSTWTNSLLDTSFSIAGGNPVHIPNHTGPKIFISFFIIASHIAFIILFALIVAYLVDVERVSTFAVERDKQAARELHQTIRDLNEQLSEFRLSYQR